MEIVMKAFVLIIVLMIANNVYGANHSDLGKSYYTPEEVRARCGL